MNNQRGFNLVEITMALACSAILLLMVGTLATQSAKQTIQGAGKVDGVVQNSEIKDLIFNYANQSSGATCVERLKIADKVFSAAGVIDLEVEDFQTQSSGSRIQRIFLSDRTDLRAIGNYREVSAQLRVEQVIGRDLASTENVAQKPVVLGLVKLTLDGAGKVISCNWDGEGAIDPLANCSSTEGTVTSTTCNSAPIVQPVTECPNGTDLQDGKCIASDVDCYNQTLGNNFDGQQFHCATLPAGYAVRYPDNFTPDPIPASSGSSAPPPATEVPPPPVAPCECGGSTIPAGSTTQLCIRAWSIDDSFFGNGSAYDDMWEVKRCNPAGQLEVNSPHQYVFDETGYGADYSWKIGGCYLTTSYKNAYGKNFTKGSCQ